MKNARTYQPPREEPGISSTWVMIKFGVSYAVAMICAGLLLLLVGWAVESFLAFLSRHL
jgi:hypothetical protein